MLSFPSESVTSHAILNISPSASIGSPGKSYAPRVRGSGDKMLVAQAELAYAYPTITTREKSREQSTQLKAFTSVETNKSQRRSSTKI